MHSSPTQAMHSLSNAEQSAVQTGVVVVGASVVVVVGAAVVVVVGAAVVVVVAPSQDEISVSHSPSQQMPESPTSRLKQASLFSSGSAMHDSSPHCSQGPQQPKSQGTRSLAQQKPLPAQVLPAPRSQQGSVGGAPGQTTQ